MSVSPISTASTPTRSSSSICCARADARLRDDDLAGGHVGEQVEGALDVDREVLEVAVVDPDHVARRARAPRSSSSSSWTSTIASRSSACASRVEPLERRACSSEPTTSRTRVGAGHLRLVELVGVDREVLAEDRQLGRRARLAQVVERAAEVRLLGEDRDRGRAAALVGAARSRRQLAPSRIVPADGERRLCSAISEVPGRDSASANGRPSRPVVDLALELGRAGARACAGATASRVASTSSSSRAHHDAAPASAT